MATLQAGNLVYYHPCESLTDAADNTWSGPILFSGTMLFTTGGEVGKAANAGGASLIDIGVTGVGYGDYTSTTRITHAFWAKELTAGGLINIGFTNPGGTDFQIAQVTANGTVNLFIGTVQDTTWNSLLSAAAGWHFYVLDFERSGGDWILRHSIDGAAFTVEAPKAGSAMSGSPTHTHVAVNSGAWLDEIAIWRGATLFTSQELSSLYDLANTHGVGLDQYTNQFTAISVASDPSATDITVSPNDNDGSGDGTTPFARNYASSTEVTLIAPATSGNRVFAGWRNDGGDTLSLSRSFVLIVSAAATITAHYESIGDSRDDHSVVSP